MWSSNHLILRDFFDMHVYIYLLYEEFSTNSNYFLRVSRTSLLIFSLFPVQFNDSQYTHSFTDFSEEKEKIISYHFTHHPLWTFSNSRKPIMSDKVKATNLKAKPDWSCPICKYFVEEKENWKRWKETNLELSNIFSFSSIVARIFLNDTIFSLRYSH